MYSRVTLLEIDTLRTDVAATVQAYRDDVLPALRARPGFAGVYVLLGDEGKGMVLTMWDGEDALDASADVAAGALARFATVFQAPPGRERYRVVLADLAEPAAA